MGDMHVRLAIIFLTEKVHYGSECVLLQNKICTFCTYKGRNVTEAEDVRIRTPAHTDAMLQAAVLRRFTSSNLPDEFIENLIS
jgi:C4-type Zn-finger protein